MGTRILALTNEAAAFAAVAEKASVTLVAERDTGAGLRAFGRGGWSLVLLDSGFADGGSLELLPRLAAATAAPVLLVARDPSMTLALRALESGARDVIAFPPQAEEVLVRLPSRREAAAVELEEQGEPEDLIGRSAAMLEVCRTVARVADSDVTVLLRGESGTGKELVARALWRRSRRRAAPFVAVNCAAIPEALLESELFGHEKGAFTGAIASRRGRFERADGGTLFLDEIGDMPLSLQAKILRVLQTREIERLGAEQASRVDVRVVAATNCDLESAVRTGRFREDLYYRLAVVELELPPLRERQDDLLLLIRHFGAYWNRVHGRSVSGIAEEAIAALRRYPWPGNVRELKNVLERAVLMADPPTIGLSHLPAEIRAPGATARAGAERPGPLATLEEVETSHIRRVLAIAEWNLTRAAEILGIHRNTLRRKVRRYGIAV